MHPCTNIWLNVSLCAGCLYLSASADIWPLLVFGEQSSFKPKVSCTVLTFNHNLSLFNLRQVWALKPVQKFNVSPLYPIRSRFWCVWDRFAFVTHNHVRVSTTQLVWREVSHSSIHDDTTTVPDRRSCFQVWKPPLHSYKRSFRLFLRHLSCFCG